MFSKLTLRAAALASTCLVPLIAYADDSGFDLGDAPAPAPAPAPAKYDNQATVGLRDQSASSALFGRYNGSPYRGPEEVGSFSLRGGDAWNSGGTAYFSAEGQDLTLNGHDLSANGSASAKYGELNSWGVSAFYDNISYQQSLTFHSVDTTGGVAVPPYSLNPLYTLNNTTLATNAAGGPPAGAPLIINNPAKFGTSSFTAVGVTNGVLTGGATAKQLLAAQASGASTVATLNGLSPQAVGTQRTTLGTAGNWTPPNLPDWTFSASFQHEHKEGTKENSMAMNNKDNVTYFPEPVNYDTDRFTAMAKYNAPDLQSVLSYSYSHFTDNNSTFNTLNPWAPATTYGPGYTGTSYSLPPSNDAHMLKAQIAYRLTPTTRVNANFGYSLMQQSAGDPVGYSGAPINPYSGGDYHAKNQNLFANLAVTARPLPKVDLRAGYTIDDRQDNSPRVFIPASANGSIVKGVLTPYGMIAADATGTNDVPIANLPVSVLTQTAKLDAGYAVHGSTKVSLSYAFTDKQRDYSVTDHTHENSLGAKVTSSLTTALNGSLGITHAVRTADSYFASAAWQASTFGDVNNPGLGMYYLAARTRDEIRGNLNWSVCPAVTTGLTTKFSNDHYPDSYFGVTNDHKISVGPDLSFTPNKIASVQLFYTFEDVYSGQNFSTTDVPTAAQTDWTLGNNDTVHTGGAKLDLQVTDDLKLSLADNLSYGATAFAEGYALISSSTGAAQIASPTNIVAALPNDKTITNSLSLTGEYQLLANLALIGRYGFERAIASDYLYSQPAGLITSAGVAALPGDGNPSYSIQLVSVSVRLRW